MNAALTLAPMSPAVAKLWHQLQAAMLKETHGLDVVPVGAIVLPPLDAGRVRFRDAYSETATVLHIGDQDNYDSFTKHWSLPHPSWESFWDQAHWRHHKSRVDSEGLLWSASAGPYVIDDFGDLVKVPQ